jgi:hypothetical protein
MTATARFFSTSFQHVARPGWWILSPIVSALLSVGVSAQNVAVTPLVTLTSEAEERARLNQLTSQAPSDWFLIRSASRFAARLDSSRANAVSVLMPVARATHNSTIPYSLNDGAMWAGRGWNAEVTAGLSARVGPVRLIAAPTFVSEQNSDFQVIPFPQDTASHGRSQWANPFHPIPESIDLPLRFGDRSRTRLDAGQSSLTVDVPVVSFGFANENVWWGPAAQNAIVLSNNAPGFPHAFVQTRSPVQTAAGRFDAQWLLGQLRESDFFDRDASNDTRSLSGLVFSWTPPGDDALTLGFSRIVMSSQSSKSLPIGAAFDVFRLVGHSIADTTKRIYTSGSEQIFSVFGRLVFPKSGIEAYAEWARFEEPNSVRDLMEFPGHSQGYTLGFQWARPLSNAKTFRLLGEASYLEPDPSLRVRPVATTYTSHSVPQGFTHRGKTLGAAIGPGASSQWITGDVFAPRWRAGAYLERIRWDNGVLFEPIVPDFKRQDVTLLAGLRGSVSWRGMSLLVDFAHAARFDYLFQAYALSPGHTGGIDLINNTVSLTLSSAVWPR